MIKWGKDFDEIVDFTINGKYKKNIYPDNKPRYEEKL